MGLLSCPRIDPKITTYTPQHLAYGTGGGGAPAGWLLLTRRLQDSLLGLLDTDVGILGLIAGFTGLCILYVPPGILSQPVETLVGGDSVKPRRPSPFLSQRIALRKVSCVRSSALSTRGHLCLSPAGRPLAHKNPDFLARKPAMAGRRWAIEGGGGRQALRSCFFDVLLLGIVGVID